MRPLHNYFERQLWTFWGTHPGEANGPLWRVNPELLEAVRPSFQDLESKLVDGSKSSYQRAKRGYAKVSFTTNNFLMAGTSHLTTAQLWLYNGTTWIPKKQMDLAMPITLEAISKMGVSPHGGVAGRLIFLPDFYIPKI